MQHKFYAFISYRGDDVKWARWFVKKSDNYLIPTVTPDGPYGDIHFRLWNPQTEQTYPNVTVTIRSASGRLLCKNGHEATADANGMIRYTMPLVEQDTLYNIQGTIPSVETQLIMPHTESTIITVEK